MEKRGVSITSVVDDSGDGTTMARHPERGPRRGLWADWSLGHFVVNGAGVSLGLAVNSDQQTLVH